MAWVVEFHDDFELEFLAFEPAVQDALLAVAKLLADYGPQLGRPYADTLKGSKHANMKELRFEALNGEWRAAFAFDPRRAGHSVGRRGQDWWEPKARFYRRLVAKADKRFSAHLDRLKAGRMEK